MACEVAPAIDGRGRRLLTTSAVPAGALLHEEEPWAAVPYELAATCASSFATASTTRRLLVCGRCRVARYADRAAQKADWPAHKPECAALTGSAPRIPSPTVRLAARCLWRAAAARSSPAPLDALESHWGDLPVGRQALFAHMAYLTRRFMSCGRQDGGGEGDEDEAGEAADGGVGTVGPPPLPPLPLIARLLARLAVNAHTITGGDGLDRVGLGLYPGPGAMANHGEPPSAVQAFSRGGGALQLRALRALAPGEEVTIAYSDAARPRPARRAALVEGYCFDIDGGVDGALQPGPPEVGAEWRSPGGGVVASASPARPPCVAGDPEVCMELVGPDGSVIAGGGAVAWLEAARVSEADDAAASFLLEEGGEGCERGQARPPSPPVCRVVAWGAWAADSMALARVATALAAAERAADAVEAALDNAAERASGAVEAALDGAASAAATGALGAADAGAAALAALSTSGGPAPGPAHFTVGRLAASTLRAALAAKAFPRALAAARAATPLLDAALPAPAPVRAHLCAVRAKLAAWAGGEEGVGGGGSGGAHHALDVEALAAAGQAVAALRICSPAAPARAELEALAGNLRAEAAGRARRAAALEL